MRMAAKIFGIVWMLGVVAGAIALIGSGTLRSGRGAIFLIFIAAVPGVVLYRWGRQLGPMKLGRPIKPARAHNPSNNAVDK